MWRNARVLCVCLVLSVYLHYIDLISMYIYISYRVLGGDGAWRHGALGEQQHLTHVLQQRLHLLLRLITTQHTEREEEEENSQATAQSERTHG